MLWMECRIVNALCGRRRMRASAVKLPCTFWFLLLFAAGGLVLFIHLQDLSEMVQQQAPDVKLSTTSQQSRETQYSNSAQLDPGQEQRLAVDGLSSPIPPMQFPARQSATPGSREQEMAPVRVNKRHRKLLKTSPVVHSHSFSYSSVSSSSFSSSSSTSSSGSIPPESWSRLAHSQEARKQLMKEVCAKYKSSISRTVTPHHVSRIFVEDKYKLLYCEVPKAGCSNWKRLLMVLGGKAFSTHNIKHSDVHNSTLKRLESFSHQEITKRLKSYSKILFVREPLERLVSAYRDKFESPNDYYHSVFGKPIISKYRVNASKKARRTGSGVTFQEFMQYLLDVHRPVGMDIHWTPASELCNPCLLDYNFIGKFEAMEEESSFLLRRIGAPRNLTLPNFKDRNPKAEKTSIHITNQYFAQLSASLRQRAYDFYYMDYLMFNYSKPFKDLYK